VKFRETTLDNGLEIVAECNARAYSTAIGFFVNTGSRDECPDTAGVSHFLEHMTFKGTPRRSAADVNRELDEIGSHSNAYTSEEHTVYYAAVLPEYQSAAVDLLADIMRPSLRKDDFETEKKVIIEEILRAEDQPPYGAFERCMEAYFGNHPLGHNILGTVDSVTALTPEAMRDYFQSRYSPGNLTLVATGNVDFDSLTLQVEALCGAWPPTDVHRTVEPSTPQSEFMSLTKESSTQEYVVQIVEGPGAADPQRFANRILAAIIGDDTGSRMYWELVDRGLAEFAAVGPYEFDGAGISLTYLSCSPDKIDRNLSILGEIQKKIQTDGVTPDELDLAKAKICSQLVRQSERPSSRLFSVGTAWLHRHAYSTVHERLERYQAVSVDDIRALIDRYQMTCPTTVCIGPLESVVRP
jgi:predicted Zn-dependent peptidase